MSEPKMLSGYELVAKGFTKIEATLPEVGLKDVTPNGSWLEQKQIQSAIEARKHLVEIERIEKSGILSIAIWKEDKMLAEVTQKVGGHWQYLGHNIGNQLYIYPEEALYLMEVNCLQLIYNDMKVSLQQAYSILLRGKCTILQYKVYSSLSRLGYRLFRHEKNELTESEEKIELAPNSNREENIHRLKTSVEAKSNESNESFEYLQESIQTVSSVKILNAVAETDSFNKMEMCDTSTTDIRKHRNSNFYQRNVEKLKSKRIKPCNNDVIHKCFNDIPCLLETQTVIIKGPEKKYIPKDINVDKNTYVINLVNIQKQIASPASSDSNIYSQNDEANGSHIRRLRNSSTSQLAYSMPSPTMSFPTQNMQFRFFNYFRPPPVVNFNLLFQRSYLPRRFGPQFTPHLGTHIRFFFNNQPFVGNQFEHNNYNYNQYQLNTNFQNRNRRRRGNAQNCHLEAIKRLALRLKQFFMSGNTNNQNIESLQRLIHTYNVRYKTKIRLTPAFEIENEQNIVDTIILEDDDEPQRKKPRNNDVDEGFEHRLNLLTELAAQLKDIENKGQSTPKHRRAFTKVLRSFNDTYSVEYYVNNEFVVINSRHITVASTSESDCRINEAQKQHTSGKKLKNPFNIMKRLSETQNELISEEPPCASTYNDNERDKQYSQHIIDAFPKNWLPPEDDFGRAEILKYDDAIDAPTDNKHEEFLYDFFTVKQNKFHNWLHLKLSFFKSLEKAITEFQSISTKENSISSSSKSEESVHMKTVADRLRIIKTVNTVKRETSLTIDYDVYNRNVQNFKKSKPPLPHFRIICLDEVAAVPPGEEIAALNAEYDDSVTIVFAIVGIASVSYVRINPIDLPMYVPSNTKI